jgi:hypothetical protein
VAKAKVMSRYVANVDKQEAKLFSELGHARRYAHTLPQGTMVVIVDLQARPVVSFPRNFVFQEVGYNVN